MIDYSSSDELRHFDVIAQAEGVISVREGVTITEAAILLRAEAAMRVQPVSKAAAETVRPLYEQRPQVP